MRRILVLVFFAALLAFPSTAKAQLDEIVVTASRIVTKSGNTENSPPGIFYERKGDFLLLRVTIENDSRELGTRLEELTQTVEGFIRAARSDDDITLSLLDDSFVRPLSIASFADGIYRGSRPDTSVATLQVKTDIPENVEDSFKLATKLGKFVDAQREIGRTKITNSDQISVSVVNPYQYRQTVMTMVLDEIKRVKTALGPDYRVVIRGLDKELNWVRSGDLNLAFTLPYTYDVIPNNLQSY
jgi:hypothetical protein